MADHADVIAPPPLIYLGGLAAGLALDWAWPAPFIPSVAVQYVVGGVIIAISVALVIPAFRGFFRAGTTIPTNEPTTAIVTAGPYRFTRNPIYLSMTVLIIGIAVAVDSAWIFAQLAVVLPVIHFGVIKREEAYLERKFGDDYLDYKKSARRWI